MSRQLEKSIVLISSAIDKKANVIGTGFAFYRTEHHTYFLTCAHVVEDVGGKENVVVKGISAEVLAIGKKNGFDLAVLRVEKLHIPPLNLVISSEEEIINCNIEISGDYHYGEEKKTEGDTIKGLITKNKRALQDSEEVLAWGLKIQEGKLERGFSGSPVFDSRKNRVIGVVTNMEGKGERGRAISVEALRYIWPQVPLEVFEQPRFPKYYFTICISSAVFTFVLGLLSGIAMLNLVSKKHTINIHLTNKDMRIEKVDIKSDNSDKVICNYDTPNGDRAVLNDCGLVSKLTNVTIEVSKVNSNRPPQGKPDRFETNKNTTKTIKKSELIENDADPDGNTFDIQQVSPESDELVTVIYDNDNDTIKYTPPNNFVGEDTFKYTLKDSFGKHSNPIEVKVIVKNTKPTGNSRNIDIYSNKNEPINIDFSNDIEDEDPGDKKTLTLQVEKEETNQGGIVRINPSNNKTITYIPPEDFTVKDTFYYKVVDRSIDSSGLEFKEESVSPIEVTINFDLELLQEYWKGKGYSWNIENYYNQIFTYLKDGKWSDADLKTYELMYHLIKISGDYYDVKENYLKPNHITNFSCEHLYIIDQLWKNTSGKRSFSFSYQKQKFQELEKTTQEDDPKLIREWAQVLGWFNGTIWTDKGRKMMTPWESLDTEAEKGYYPMGGMFIGKYNNKEESLDEQKVDAHRQSLMDCPKIKP